ncbi:MULTISPECIES: sensor histidine kinase [unclassified Nocardia]|uniref:sensor histidine kinase n=1 Tax=unclassified Nocardia TaxID=2637762 RepID=UPI001CE3F3BD|nr:MULTISPECIES: sensor histidine kinase [unclassified Nocardia]
MNPLSLSAWQRFRWVWDVVFGVAYVGTVAYVLTEEPTTAVAARLVSVAALTGIAIVYLLQGRRVVASENNDAQRWLFAGVVLLLIVVAMFADSKASFGLFIVCPLVYMTLDFKPAAALTSLTIMLSLVASIVHNGAEALAILVPMIVIVFSMLTGRYITGIIEESHARAELIERLEASQAEVARLSREAGTATERERLAREIHDTLAQGFTSIVTLTQAIESEMDTDPAAARRHLGLAARTARENLGEARTMVAALAPSDLTAGSLEEALRRLADRLAEESTLTVTYEVDRPLPRLPMATEVVLLRAAQEALANIRKHASASAVLVRVSVVDDSVRLLVHDDGAGFDPGAPADGFGLSGMRSRAGQIGGRLSIHSGYSEGTDVELEVPA